MATSKKGPRTKATSESGGKLTPEASAEITDQVMRGARAGADYNAVVAAAVLTRVRLIGTRFELKPQFDDVEKPSLGFGGELSGANFNEETGVGGGLFTWWVEAQDGEEQILNLTATYAVTYDGLKGRNADAVRRFVDRFGRFAVYPYFRALVSQFSWASDTSLPVLPILKDDDDRRPAPPSSSSSRQDPAPARLKP